MKDGDVDYSSPKVGFSMRGLSAIVEPLGDSYVLTAEAGAASVWMDAARAPLEGRLSLIVQAGPQQIKVRRLSLAGREGLIRAAGDLSAAPEFAGSLAISYGIEMAAVARLVKIPFNWDGRLEGKGTLTRDRGALSFRTEFSSEDMALNGVPMEKARGQVEVLPGRGVLVNLNLLKATGAEAIRIHYVDREVRGNLQGYHLEPIFSYFNLPYPVRSPIWGDFSVTDLGLTADFEFREQDLAGVQPGKYGLRGPCHFTWDRGRTIAFELPRLETAFGRLDVNGEIVTDRSLEISITGDVTDVKDGREFAGLVLGAPLKLPEIRGGGQSTIRIFGSISRPDVSFDFRLAPAGFDKFDLAAADGTVRISRGAVDGHFSLSDPEIKGQVDLVSGEDRLDVSINLSEGELTRILPGLSLPYPFSGKVAGEFQVATRGGSLRVEGGFASPLIKFKDEAFQSVSGRLIWDGESIAFPELAFDYRGGKASGSWKLNPLGQVMDIDMAAKEIDLNRLAPGLSGRLSFDVKGSGRLGERNGAGRFRIEKLLLDPIQTVEAEGDLELRLSMEKVGLSVKGILSPGANDVAINALIPFADDGLTVDAKGGFSNLDILLPWKGAKGRLNYTVEVRGSLAAPQVSGAIDIQGSVLPFPRFAQALTDYSGLVIVNNNRASIRSFRGKLGGGEILGGGEVVLERGRPPTIDLTFQGKNLQLSPFERTLATADVLFRLARNTSRFVLEGNIDVHRALWRREVYEKLAFSSVRYPQSQRKPGFFDDMNLSIHLRASDNALMENAVGRIRGKFDLTVTGNVLDPILLGTIDLISGQASFQDRTFQILRGRLSFFSLTSTEPYIEAQAETYVKDYRVMVTLSGLASQLRPEFSSSPPLPSEEVLTLLALGEAFRRTYRPESSTQLSSASLVSFQLTEPAQKTAEKLLSVERIRIDPFLMGSSAEMRARLTVGKDISSKVSIYYSTNLMRQTEEIIRLEWDLSKEFSLVATRNEFGRVSLDFKIRRRF